MTEIKLIRDNEWDSAMALVWKTFLKFEAGDYPEKGIRSFLDFISDETLRKMFLIGEYLVFGYYKDDKIVGVIAVRSRNHVSLLFVDEKYHKEGIGRKLITYCASYVEKNTKEQSLTVNSSPYAVEFYHKCGFQDKEKQQEKDGIIYTPMKLLLKRSEI